MTPSTRRVPGDFQNELYAGMGHVVQSVSRWALKTGVNRQPIGETVKAMRKAVSTLEATLPSLLPEFMKEETEIWYQLSVENCVPRSSPDGCASCRLCRCCRRSCRCRRTPRRI